MTRYQDLAFVQGEEADPVLDVLNERGEAAALAYLLDNVSEPGKIRDDLGVGEGDTVYRTDAHVLNYNLIKGYAGLSLVIGDAPTNSH